MKLPSDNNKQVAGGKKNIIRREKMYVKVIGTKSNRNNFLRPLQIERRCMSGQSLFVVYLKKNPWKKRKRQKSLNKSWDAAMWGRWIENAGLNDGSS